jgi:hypothetical protein
MLLSFLGSINTTWVVAFKYILSNFLQFLSPKPPFLASLLLHTHIYHSMAHLARICFVLLFLSHELLLTTTEGRTLRQSIEPPNIDSTKTTMSIPTNITKIGVAKSSQIYHRRLEGDVEAFRPTTPGHSPGIGHSINS